MDSPAAEGGFGKDAIWLLLKAMNGVRLGPKEFSEYTEKAMAALNFERLAIDPQVYRHRTRKLFALYHVDDLLLIGKKEDREAAVTAGTAAD